MSPIETDPRELNISSPRESMNTNKDDCAYFCLERADSGSSYHSNMTWAIQRESL